MPTGREPRTERNPDEPAFGSGARTPDADAAADPASTAVWKAPAGTEASLGGEDVLLGGEDILMKDPTIGSLGGDELYPGDPHANSLEEKPYLTGDDTGGDTTAQVLDSMESMGDI